MRKLWRRGLLSKGDFGREDINGGKFGNHSTIGMRYDDEERAKNVYVYSFHP